MTFKITDGKGYHITFPNGYTVSVQFGFGNYCDNRNDKASAYGKLHDTESTNAEVAVWDGNRKWTRDYPHNSGNDDVEGYLSPMQVLDILNWASQQTTTKG